MTLDQKELSAYISKVCQIRAKKLLGHRPGGLKKKSQILFDLKAGQKLEYRVFEAASKIYVFDQKRKLYLFLSDSDADLLKADLDQFVFQDLTKTPWKSHLELGRPRLDERFNRNLGYQVLVKSSKGEFVVELFPKSAPLMVLNFLNLSFHGFFDSLSFHRVVKDFVVQSGDPNGDGTGGPGYKFKVEKNSLKHRPGSLSMVSSGVQSHGSQFFISLKKSSYLDKQYTVFGQVRRGMEIVERLKKGDQIIHMRPYVRKIKGANQ